jgi:hypothetical protein
MEIMGESEVSGRRGDRLHYPVYGRGGASDHRITPSGACRPNSIRIPTRDERGGQVFEEPEGGRTYSLRQRSCGFRSRPERGLGWRRIPNDDAIEKSRYPEASMSGLGRRTRKAMTTHLRFTDQRGDDAVGCRIESADVIRPVEIGAAIAGEHLPHRPNGSLPPATAGFPLIIAYRASHDSGARLTVADERGEVHHFADHRG